MDAERFAALWAGCDLSNPSEAEALGKFKLVRRMVAAENLRIIDALELPEIVAAIDGQMQPARRSTGNEAELRDHIARLEEALVARERDAAELVDRYEAQLAHVTAKVKKTAQPHRGLGEFLSYTWSFAEWRMVVLLALIATHIGTAERLPGWTVVPFAVAGIWLLLLWCAAEIDQTGWGRLLIKIGVVGAGCVAAHAQPAFGLAILGGLTLVAATRLINNLSDRLMEVDVIEMVIGWFV